MALVEIEKMQTYSAIVVALSLDWGRGQWLQRISNIAVALASGRKLLKPSTVQRCMFNFQVDNCARWQHSRKS